LTAIERAWRRPDRHLRPALSLGLLPWLAGAASFALAVSAHAAPPTQPSGPGGKGSATAGSEVAPLVVTAQRKIPYSQQPGAVVGDIEPEEQLDPSDIQSYGVSTVTELLNELAPQTRSDRGRSQTAPVLLLNGRRISSLNEIQNIPTEAILRVDILPE